MKKIFYLLVLILGTAPIFANAATLKMSPFSNSYDVGNTFLLTVYVSSPTETLNAASGKITFPKDKLEVVSLSKSGSIFNFWVTEPTFSNSIGSISFEGVVLNPGFIGEFGKIVTINFRVKSSGNATVNFDSGSVLANDGRGSNILTGLGGANFVLKPAVNNAITASVSGGADDESLAISKDDIDSPIITYHPEEIRAGKTIIIKGTTYENSEVTVWFNHGDQSTSQVAKSDGHGEFVFVNAEGLHEGAYRFWVTVTHPSGVQSNPSEEFTLLVRPLLAQEITSSIFKFLLSFLPAVIALLVVAFAAWYAWQKFIIFRTKIKLEVEEAELGTHKAFRLLKEDIHSTKIRKELNDAEEFVEKKIKDIGKELR